MSTPADPTPAPTDAEIYTLRVWRHGTHFRAVLRAVGDEQLHLFTEPQRVAEFLAATPAPPAPPGTDARSQSRHEQPPDPDRHPHRR